MSEQTLAEVMWEIAEARERGDLIDGRELRRRILARLERMDAIKPDFLGQRTAAGNAFLQVLGWIEEMQKGQGA